MYSLDIRDLPGEIWKDIKGFEGIYQVSNKGRAKSLDRYKLKKGSKKPTFYPSQILRVECSGGKKEYLQSCRVNLGLGYMKDKEHAANKKFSLNRLVAEAFIPNPNNYDVVLHKDGDITNNCIENLEWTDIKGHRDHERYTLGRELGMAKKKVLCIETGIIYESLQEAACAMGLKVSEATHSNHAGLTKALQKLTVSAGKYKPNPKQIWHGYHWKEIN